MNKERSTPARRLIPALAVVLALLAGLAAASGLRQMSLEDVVRAADVIAVGRVMSQEARWVDKRIETTIRVAADEYWKGDLGESFEITQMGGEVQRPLPIAMYADGQPRFFQGERVILFLEKPKKASFDKGEGGAKESRLTASPRIVGWAYGKYTILRDPKSGEDKALPLGLMGATVLDRREIEGRMRLAAQYAGAKEITVTPVTRAEPEKAATVPQATIMEKQDSGVAARIEKPRKSPEPQAGNPAALLKGSNAGDAGALPESGLQGEHDPLSISKGMSVTDLKSRVLEHLK